MIQRPYTKGQQRKGKFVLCIKYPAKVPFKKRLAKWVRFNFKKEPLVPHFVVADKELKKYKLVTELTEARSFDYDEAVKALRRIPIDDLRIWMIQWTGKNWILS